MLRFTTLGAVQLRGEHGEDLTKSIAQPKRLALLAYLTVAGAGRYVRRDTIVALLWPDLPQDRARAALRKALHHLRSALSSDVVRSRGEDEICIDETRLRCDARELTQLADRGETSRALQLYAGDFLSGLHVADAIEFEQWMDNERYRIRRIAVECAIRLAREHLRDGEFANAVKFARRSVELSPTDEATNQLLITALVESGDRSAAIDAYERFEGYLRRELQLEPSDDLKILIERTRTDRSGQARRLALTKQTQVSSEATASRDLAAGEPNELPPISRAWMVRRYWPLAFLVTVAALGWRYSASRRLSALPRVVVGSYHNATGDRTLDEAGFVVARYVSTAMAGLGTVDVVPSSEPPRDPTFSITGSYQHVGDSLEFLTEITDNTRKRALPAPRPVRASFNDPMAGRELIASRAAGAIGYYTSIFGAQTKPERTPPNYSAYLSFSDGLQWMFQSNPVRAEGAFRRAIDIDSTYTEAFLLLGGYALYNEPGSTARRGGLIGRFAAIDSLAARLSAAATPLTRTDQLVVDVLRATARGDLMVGLRDAAQLSELVPASSFGVGFRGVWANRPRDAIEGLHRLDPNSGWTREWWRYWQMLTSALHEKGDYASELRAAREGHRRFPANRALHEAELRAEIALGELENVRQSAVSLPPDEALILGLELRAHGKLSESNALLEQVANRQHFGVSEPDERRLTAIADLALGRVEAAIPLLEHLVVEDSLRLDYKGMLATAYAREGRSDAARRLDREIVSIAEPYLHGLATLWRARIAARLGDRANAVRLLTSAFDEGVIYMPRFPVVTGTFWHTDIDFEPLASDESFRQAVQPR